MKIIHIRSSLHGGGAERVVIELCSIKRNLNNNSYIYVTSDNVKYKLPQGVAVIKSSMPLFIKKLCDFLYTLCGSLSFFISSYAYTYYFKKDIKFNAKDKVFIHSVSSIFPFIYLRGNNVYNVYHCAKKRLLIDNKKRFYRIKNKCLLKFSAKGKGAIAVSQGVKNELETYFGIKVNKVIYNPFNIKNINFMLNVDSQGDISPYGKYILNAGRLSYQKNHSALIKAFSAVKDEYDSLLILGEGPEKTNLEHLVKELDIVDQVHFLGFSENPYFYMKNAELFVLTSRFEGFGNVIVESLISGCPVIASNCDYGPSEILTGELSK